LLTEVQEKSEQFVVWRVYCTVVCKLTNGQCLKNTEPVFMLTVFQLELELIEF